MIAALKQAVKARWPRLRLRTILFASLFFVAALPGFGAIFLRVYENTLVRQTEAELVAQGAALAAAAQIVWPGAGPPMPPDPGQVRPEPPSIDLNSTPILPERTPPAPIAHAPAASSVQAAKRLLPVLAATRQTTLASIILLDGAGNILIGPGTAGSYAALPEVRSALAGQSATVLRRNGDYRQVYRFEWLSRAAAIRVHHARPVIVDGRVVGVLLLSRSARALFKGLYEDRGKIAFGILVIFGILVVLSGVLSRGIARPIEALSVATRAVSAGGGAMPAVPPTAAIEIQGLYVDFAAMAQAIDRRSRYLRDFAHAVSHEFKTPLAGIRGALELLRDHAGAMSNAERDRFLTNADADAERLTLLVSRLLELARADMSQAAAPAETRLAPIVAKIADAERAPGFDIVMGDPGTLAVAAPADTIEAVLAALIDNSRQAGAATVTIDIAAAGDTIAITISDNGPGIAEPDRARIFEPFFTTRRSRGGTGLGLPIVRSLLQAHGGAIERVEQEDGTAFRVTLPRADP
ncbi:HAMP domain-containing sensor histidine kinase [Sphingomonas sp. dw_22]|uniref:sensor histidine kinase n=1 Tax=Sphingomonas sp. dw_22 TaxID=2721175 RepID=UPI001BD3B0B7|nr:HAMP domain-containing sensor histidine kinase [Sphingomonas sp. dw_22]